MVYNVHKTKDVTYELLAMDHTCNGAALFLYIDLAI